MLGIEAALPLLPAPEREEGLPLLRSPTEGEDIVADYRALGLTLARHPLALLRPRLEQDGWLTAAEVADLADGAPLATGGIVVTRQRPGSAGGVIFVTLEDETGYVNLVVWSRIADAHRKAMLGARLLGVRGRLQRRGRGPARRGRCARGPLGAAGEPDDEGEELPLAPPGSRDAARLLRGPGAGLVDVVVLEVGQEARGAFFLANALELAPGGLRGRGTGATTLAGVEIPHQPVDVEVLGGFLEFVRLLVLEFFFRLLAHATSPGSLRADL